MLFVEICVGSSCHLKGAPEIVSLFESEIAKRHLETELILSGSFCTGRCNREGVTVTVGDEIFTGVTPTTFPAFFCGKSIARHGKSKGVSCVKLSDAEKIKLQKLL